MLEPAKTCGKRRSTVAQAVTDVEPARTDSEQSPSAHRNRGSHSPSEILRSPRNGIPAETVRATASDVTANSGQTVWWLCDRRHEWQAMINNRRKARGCPQCTLWGTSVEEIRLRHELLAAGVPIDPNHEVVHEASGRVLQCDMLCSAWNVVIEFDGNRFHKLPDSAEKDGAQDADAYGGRMDRHPSARRLARNRRTRRRGTALLKRGHSGEGSPRRSCEVLAS